MKESPKVNSSPKVLDGILIAPIRSKLMLTGIELRVFNYLSEPKSADAVAKTIGTHPKNTKLFLDGLVVIDLLHKKNGLYRNKAITQAFLVEDSPTYLGQVFTFTARSYSPVLENLSKLVKEGPPDKPEMEPFSEEMVAQSVAIMVSIERVMAQEVVKIISELPEFSKIQKMLDLGGGPGLIGIAIVASHPNMKGVNFDMPPIVKMAEIFIKKYEMEDRIWVLGGDFNRDSIGEGYDLILASGSLQFAKDLDFVVKKIFDALNPSGVFVSIFPFGQTHERTKPETVVLSLLSTALMGYETGFDQGRIADSMLRVDFSSVHSRKWDSSFGPMELDIARK